MKERLSRRRIPEATPVAQLREFVRIGYGDRFGLSVHSDRFATGRMDAPTAAEVVKVIKRWESFSGERVARAITEIAGVWRSEYQQVAFRFGRESSPVLYVVMPYWLSREWPLSEFERDLRIRATEGVLLKAGPDELDLDELRAELRAWWD